MQVGPTGRIHWQTASCGRAVPPPARPPPKLTAKFSDIGVTGSHKLRDLWKHEDFGSRTGEFSADVPSHGVVMVKFAK